MGPEMDASAIRWLWKTARKNYWRVSHWYDLDDLVQDGYLHYARLCNKYPDIEIRAHIMGLFKRIYLNHIHDLSKRRTRGPVEVLECDLLTRQTDSNDESPLLWESLCAVDSEQDFFDLIASAPTPVQQILNLFTTEASCKLLRAPYRWRHGTRETFNERLCRMLGYSPDQIDLAGILRGYLNTLTH
jgi:hypothetical protein